jgi:hypothetical protein
LWPAELTATTWHLGWVRCALASSLLLVSCAQQDVAKARSGTPVTNPPLPAGPEFYVSPSGSASGDGSRTKPWDLQTALNQPGPVSPGSTIWLRGGRYTGGTSRGGFLSTLTGTADAPIVVRQFPGERAIVTNSLDVRGSYTWFWGFDVTSARQAAPGTEYEYLVGVRAGVGNRFINLVIHDGPNTGLASFTPLYTSATQTTIYGCLIYNNGTHFNLDHGLYLQNDVANGTVTVTDNIVFNNEAFGLHIYSRPADGRLSGFDIEGNVLFGNGSISTPVNRNNELLIGGTPAASDIVVRGNYTYREMASGFSPYRVAAEIGYTEGARANGDVLLENNYFVGGFYINRWSSATVRGNLVYDYGGPMVLTDSSVSDQTWSDNRFYGVATLSNWQHAPDRPADFATWRAQTGLTGPGSYEGSGTPPNLVVVRPNQYEAGRANIVVYNWERHATVSADFSMVLTVGDRYVVRNVQDFDGTPVASGTYEGGSIQLPMAAVTPPAVIGRASTSAPITGPTFNVFVVMKAP